MGPERVDPPCRECDNFILDTEVCTIIDLKVDKRTQNMGPCYDFVPRKQPKIVEDYQI